MWNEGVKGVVLTVASLILVFIGMPGCGRMPPPAIWQPNAEDSAAIQNAVLENKPLLEMRFAEDGFQRLLEIPDTPDTIIHKRLIENIKKAIRDNPFKMRFKCDSMQHIFFDDSIRFRFSFVAVCDTAKAETTATVTVVETIPGILRLHAWTYTRYVKDSIIVTPSETIRLPYHDTVFTDTSFIVEKPLHGVVFGGCVLRKENGAWRLWKLAGGKRFYAPTQEDAPYLLAVYLTDGVREDTIALRPDTLHFGMQRLYEYPDGLLSYDVGDTIWVRALYTAATDANNFVIFEGKRFRMTTTNRIGFSRTGVQWVYVEQVPYGVFYDSGGELNAVVWGIPINVKGGAQ